MLQRLLLTLLAVSWLVTSVAASTGDQFTPVVVSVLTPTVYVFPGTDDRQHLVYELLFTNASATPATLNKVEVVDAASPGNVLATFAGDQLLRHLRTAGDAPVKDAVVPPSDTYMLLLDYSFDAGKAVPARIMHRVDLSGAGLPAHAPVTPVALSYVVAPAQVSHELRTIGPPLRGTRWVATNGCCEPNGVHRGTMIPVNGNLVFAQRFAIDYMRLDDAGRFVSGDPSKVTSYDSYGADILAVADGTVVEAMNDLNNQTPGTLPDPSTINIENVDGNHVVIDLGGGVYAFFAHMQKNSVTVHKGDHVKRGQVLGKLGNTGNTSAPHLHFQLMDGASPLASQGIPYKIGNFELAGQIPTEKFNAAPGIEGDWGKGALTTPTPHREQFPLDANILNF